jgi:hypothetical protein
MTAASRIYIVTARVAASPNAPRLVRAVSVAQALRHVAQVYQATVASQDDLIEHVGKGVMVEDATTTNTEADDDHV